MQSAVALAPETNDVRKKGLETEGEQKRKYEMRRRKEKYKMGKTEGKKNRMSAIMIPARSHACDFSERVIQ